MFLFCPSALLPFENNLSPSISCIIVKSLFQNGNSEEEYFALIEFAATIFFFIVDTDMVLK